MNPLIQYCSRENHFKLLSRQLTVESFDVLVRGSPIVISNEFKLIWKLACRRVVYQYPNTQHKFQRHFKGKFVI